MTENLWRARYVMERKKDGKMVPHYIIDDIKYHRNNVSYTFSSFSLSATPLEASRAL